jgi:hypothetical protein
LEINITGDNGKNRITIQIHLFLPRIGANISAQRASQRCNLIRMPIGISEWAARMGILLE